MHSVNFRKKWRRLFTKSLQPILTILVTIVIFANFKMTYHEHKQSFQTDLYGFVQSGGQVCFEAFVQEPTHVEVLIAFGMDRTCGSRVGRMNYRTFVNLPNHVNKITCPE